MSSALALAAVTAVLKDLLDNGMKARKVADAVGGGDVIVSAQPPDRIPTDSTEPTQLNLFLHQVTINAGWRNVDYPSHDAHGDRIANPPLALNLHYLLTAFGAKDFFPEILLGHAMQLLHETPVLTRAAIRKALNPAPPPAGFPAALATSDLAEQAEQIKITPEILNTEEISKLWAAMQARYRPTAAYLVTVVLIESHKPSKTALPVRSRGIYALPFHQPFIERVVSATADNQPITAGGLLAIHGARLLAANVQVLIGGIDLSGAIRSADDAKIVLELPKALPPGLRAGVQPVSVAHPVEMGAPPQPHPGFESNVEAFVLRPTITPTPKSVTSSVEDGVTIKAGKMRLACVPNVGRDQRVVLLLNEFNTAPGAAGKAYSFKAPAGNGILLPSEESATVEVPFQRVIPAQYLVRAQINGAESVLELDAVTGKFSSPRVTI